MTNHTNDERTVRCPVEGCDATPLARGINLHLRRSSGGGHGPQNELPEEIDLDNLTTVGEREVEMDYPEKRDTEDVARLCPYCSQPFSGQNGVLIHLGQVAGRKNHPEDGGEFHSEDDFPEVEVDERGNVVSVVGETNTPEHTETAKAGSVPNQRVYQFIADLLADGEVQTAHRVRKRLLGIENVDRPFRSGPSHPKVFNEILEYGYDAQRNRELTAALEAHGVMIALGGESGLYTADEVLDLAAYLDGKDLDSWDQAGKLKDFVAFLRYSAELLQNETPPKGLHEEFQEWR